jgi:opacity protein-like surface antigen
MVSMRVGFWSALEARNVDPKPGEDILTKVTTPYGEIHFSLGLKKGFAVGFSTGSCYRGETRYSDPDGYYWKRVTIYPFTAELKYYPLHLEKSKWQPYLDGGAGLISGTEILRFGEYSGPLLLLGSTTDTYLTFGWHAGGGVDIVLSKSFALGVDFKYRVVRFGDEVGGMKDYSGPEATLGISYIFKAL